VIDEVIAATPLSKHTEQTSPSMLLVMVFDFLIGGGIKGGGSVKKLVVQHEAALKTALVKLKARLSSILLLLPPYLPPPPSLPCYISLHLFCSSSRLPCFKYNKALFTILSSIQVKAGATSTVQLLPPYLRFAGTLPRYVRFRKLLQILVY
jgi:hypothetical protein